MSTERDASVQVCVASLTPRARHFARTLAGGQQMVINRSMRTVSARRGSGRDGKLSSRSAGSDARTGQRGLRAHCRPNGARLLRFLARPGSGC